METRNIKVSLLKAKEWYISNNPTLKELYKNFGKNMKDLENMREDHLKTLKELIIPVTEFYPTKLKKIK